MAATINVEALQRDDVQKHVSKYVSTMLGYRRQSQAELALAVKMSPFQIGRRLDGQTPWTPAEALDLADEFGVPVDDILAGIPKPPWDITHREGA